MHHRIKTVYLVCKRSMYQRFILDEQDATFQKLFRTRHASVKSIRGGHITHLKSVQNIQKHLNQLGIRVIREFKDQTQKLPKVDLVITLGGDGTFLRTAHYAENHLILPVNSDPKQSVGALCSTDAAGFAKKISALLNGRCKIKELPLINIRINNKALAVEAINDVLFTNISPAATSRYTLKVGRKTEKQKSSGIWISTAQGSTAAINAAGGKKMPSGDKRLQFATREPYQGNFNPYKLTHGFVAPGKKITIANTMVHARIYVDGPAHAFDLDYGDKVECSLSKKTLKVVV